MLSNQLSENKRKFCLGDKIKLRPPTIKLSRAGLTFLEIVIALSILSVALVEFLQIFNIALNATYRATQETIATNLARGLMAEIMSKNFEDPTAPSPSFGIEAGESRHGGVGNAFDDVDDYDNYPDGPPPVAVGGLPMDGTTDETPNYARFSRGVSVVYCDISGSSIVEVGGSSYKRITVTVSGPYVTNISINEIKAK